MAIVYELEPGTGNGMDDAKETALDDLNLDARERASLHRRLRGLQEEMRRVSRFVRPEDEPGLVFRVLDRRDGTP